MPKYRFRANSSTAIRSASLNVGLSGCSIPGSGCKLGFSLGGTIALFFADSGCKFTIKRKIDSRNIDGAYRAAPNIDSTYHNALRTLNEFPRRQRRGEGSKKSPTR